MKTIPILTKLARFLSVGLVLANIADAQVSGAAEYEWTFSHGNLEAILGNGVLSYADDLTTSGLTLFGVSDGAVVPHIDGQPASFMHVPALTSSANGYNLTLSSSAPNGGGSYINQYTFIFDVLVPETLDWLPFFNTDPDNANDADFYLASDGSLGISSLGYSSGGVITPNQWYRVAFAADLGAGTVAYYVNGTQVWLRTGATLLDGRFSLYSQVDPGPDVRLFNEGDSSGIYTHELYVSSIAATDRMMTSTEIASLGTPKATGVFVRTVHIERTENRVVLTWKAEPNVRLQWSASVTNSNWQEVPGTLGTNSYSESSTRGSLFYRLSAQ